MIADKNPFGGNLDRRGFLTGAAALAVGLDTPAFGAASADSPELAAVWNDHEVVPSGPHWGRHNRTPLSAALSSDDGETWHGARKIEPDPKGWFCYVALEPLDDGSVLLGYCAYKMLAHTRLVKIPLSWFYGKEK